MKVIILAAGRGSRLGMRTKDRPKCMCTLQGKTLLDRCLDTLDQAKISREDIAIVTGYCSNMFDIPGVTYFHNENWEKTNMFYSLTMAEEWLKREPCIVCYSDIVFSSKVVQVLIDCSEPLAITSYSGYWSLWEKRMNNPLKDLETFRVNENGLLQEIGKEPQDPQYIQCQFIGLLRFTPESWSWVEETIRQTLAKPLNQLDMTTLLHELVQRGYDIQTISTDELWLECDSEHDIAVYEEYFGDVL